MYILFPLSYRAGSSLFLSLLGKDGDTRCECSSNKEIRNDTFYSVTIPKFKCKFASNLEGNEGVTGFWYRLGNKISPGVWNINVMKDGDWKIVPVIRDGKNQVASWEKKQAETTKVVENPFTFEDFCMGVKYRSEYILSLRDTFPTHIIKFEDLCLNPTETMVAMAKFLGVEYDRKISSITTGPMQHSSWGKLEGMNERWLGWDKQKKETFHKIVGDSQEKLGYK